MKFTDAITSLIKKKDDGKEYYFSLYMDTGAAAVAVWSMDTPKKPTIASFAHGLVGQDTWDARVKVIDRLLSAAEDKVGATQPITKTVYGMPGVYLTPEANISDAIKPELKKMSKVLELTPVGFVPLSQALANQLRTEEGVPPSIILIGCSKSVAHITVFRVGKMMTDDAVELGTDPSPVVEAVLKKHQDGDVLPSRMLLYGGDPAGLEEIRAKLLKHPWPTRTNFMHFPKIDVVSVEALLTAVSLAGAAELAADVGEVEETAAGMVSTVVAQPRPTYKTPEEPLASDDGEEDETEEDASADDEESPDDEDETEEATADASPVASDDTEDEAETIGEAIEKEESQDEIANVKLVTPESLGFRTEDVLEKSPAVSPHPGLGAGKPMKAVGREELEEALDAEEDETEEPQKKKFAFPMALPTLSRDLFKPVLRMASRLRAPKSGSMALIAGGVGLILLLGVLFYFLPRVTVTVLVSPQSIDESTVLTVDPTATVADPSKKMIPGHTQTKSVSGEKTVAVTGKKSIGDPAKGTVTIYNKVTNAQTFSKGTVLSGNGMSFTLDGDVSVASASEDIGSITFGKATATVTAKDIGPNGNLPAGTDFTFAGISASNASARNDSSFAGGTSKQVTVVSRADQDGLVTALTADLVGQAKSQLLAGATGGERLIDQTIKTSVSDKSFDQEIDQQTSQLHGKITITVTGISISDDDVKGILTSLVGSKVPSGYTLAPDQTNVSVADVTVKKDGSITLTAKLTAVALPQIDTAGLKGQLVGKDVSAALAILKQTNGVAGAEYKFSFSPTSSRLPMNKNNITITTMVQQ